MKLLARVRLAERPVVLVDGGSGSGKTTLAAALAPALSAQLVRLDDIYRGWDGLEGGSLHIECEVLSLSHPRWQRFDWELEEPAEWHDLDAGRSLVIEGSGCLSRANRARASFAIWVELDEPTRKSRALQRDGDSYAPHWDRWARQEKAFAERENPRGLADLILTDDDVSAIIDELGPQAGQ